MDEADLRRRRSGFTLIELLVVVAIIALLISILLPSLRKAKELAKVAICAANQRNMNTAVHGYASEHGGSLPSYRRDGADCPSSNWSITVKWNHSFLGGSDENNVNTDNPGRRKLNPYVESPGMFECPADHGSTAAPWRVNGDPGTNLFRWWGCSYYYMGSWYGGTYTDTDWGHAILWGKRMEDMEEVHLQLSTGDATVYYTFAYLTWFPQGPHATYYMWHDLPSDHPGEQAESSWYFYGPKCNVGFLDGHVSFLRLGPYGVGDNSVNTSRYILDPNRD